MYVFILLLQLLALCLGANVLFHMARELWSAITVSVCAATDCDYDAGETELCDYHEFVALPVRTCMGCSAEYISNGLVVCGPCDTKFTSWDEEARQEVQDALDAEYVKRQEELGFVR